MGHVKDWEQLNTSTKAVLPYNHVDGQPAPYKMAGAQVNQGLTMVLQMANDSIPQTAGLFAANMGDNPGLQSGVAIDSLKESGDTGTLDYFESQEIAITHTGRILVDAIPKVYDGSRMVRILSEDGSFDMEKLNDMIQDQQTGEITKLNDLSKGRYDVTCEVGKSFSSRQSEAVAAFTEIGGISPEIIQANMDVFLRNITAPGMDIAADRARAQLLQAGAIPEDQYTDEEIQKIQQMQAEAANQPQEPDAMMVMAQAEMQKAQMEGEKNQISMQKQQMDFEIKSAQTQLKQQQMQIDLQEKQAKFNLDQQKFEADAVIASQKQQLEQQKLQIQMAGGSEGQRQFDVTSEQNAAQFQSDIALRLTDMEMKYGQQLNGEVKSNMDLSMLSSSQLLEALENE